jgi:hypothetical protein
MNTFSSASVIVEDCLGPFHTAQLLAVIRLFIIIVVIIIDSVFYYKI